MSRVYAVPGPSNPKRPYTGRATNPDIDDPLTKQKWDYAAGLTEDRPWRRIRRSL